jgi:hypothetical protein
VVAGAATFDGAVGADAGAVAGVDVDVEVGAEVDAGTAHEAGGGGGIVVVTNGYSKLRMGEAPTEDVEKWRECADGAWRDADEVGGAYADVMRTAVVWSGCRAVEVEVGAFEHGCRTAKAEVEQELEKMLRMTESG